jgi:hypothetical protein
MEGHGRAYGNTDNSFHGSGTGGFCGTSQGEAFARGGFQRPYQRNGYAGFHGGRGAGRRNEVHGHGFGGRFRAVDNRAEHGSDSRQLPILPRASIVEMGGSQQQLHGRGMTGASLGDQPQGQHTNADHSEIPANMVSLFKQFMETMYKQEEAKGVGQKVNKEHKGKEIGG